MHVIEYDSGTLDTLNRGSHPYEAEIDKCFRKLGVVIGDESFYQVSPLVFLVNKEPTDPWAEAREKIKSNVQAHFRDLDDENVLNFAFAIYQVKNDAPNKSCKGLSADTDMITSIPAVVSIPDKGTVVHETAHLIKKLFYPLSSTDVGGVAGFFSTPPETYSLFNIEFLPYLLEYGGVDEYVKYAKQYPFAQKEMDAEYISRLKEFASEAVKFIRTHEDGLLSLLACYPIYRQEIDPSRGNVWGDFEVPDNPAEDLAHFEAVLLNSGYDPQHGITKGSQIGEFLRNQFERYSGQGRLCDKIQHPERNGILTSLR